jgi:hypothetical protein
MASVNSRQGSVDSACSEGGPWLIDVTDALREKFQGQMNPEIPFVGAVCDPSGYGLVIPQGPNLTAKFAAAAPRKRLKLLAKYFGGTVLRPGTPDVPEPAALVELLVADLTAERIESLWPNLFRPAAK